MSTTNRRYDIDWLRVIAIGLLLLYHVAIGFQSWGIMLGFITNDKPWESLWIPMTMLNVWRIPLLFFVSGMGFILLFKTGTGNNCSKSGQEESLSRLCLGFSLSFPSAYIFGNAIITRELKYSPNPGIYGSWGTSSFM